MANLLLKIADLPAELPQIYKVRYLVFQIEQGVDPSLEFDGADSTATHLLAYLDEKPVGTARIRRLNDRTAKVERVAVVQAARGLGIGKKLMEKALEYLESTQIAEVQIHAQTSVQAFYEKWGFMAEGNVFEEAGISHIKMRKQL